MTDTPPCARQPPANLARLFKTDELIGTIAAVWDAAARLVSGGKLVHRAVQRNPVATAIAKESAKHHRIHRKEVKRSLTAWVKTLDARVLLAGLDDGDPLQPISDNSVTEFLAITQLPDATRLVAESILGGFIIELQRTLATRDGTFRVMRQITAMQGQQATAVALAPAPSGDPNPTDTAWNDRLDVGKKLAQQN